MFFTIFSKEETPFNYKNKKFKKSKNWDFFKGVSPWIWSKIGNFFLDFDARENKPEKCFYDILEGRSAFLDCKNKKFKKSKNWEFFKEVSPWIWSIIGNFFFGFRC